MNPVVHFEIPYKDKSRIIEFYRDVFGWKLQDLGESYGHYILATTAETDVRTGSPAGAINGEFFPIKPDWPSQYPSIVIGVNNIAASIKKISSSGNVLGEPIHIPNFGDYVSFEDTEGNRVSIIQPEM